MVADAPETYLTIEDAAKRLRVTHWTIRNWLERHVFNGVTKVAGKWLIPESEIRRLLEEGKR